MNADTIKKLKAYEKLMLEKRMLENELEALKEELVPELPADKTVETELGVFSIKSKTSWKYSPKVKDAEEKIKTLKQREQQDGTAEPVKGSPYLEYREKGVTGE